MSQSAGIGNADRVNYLNILLMLGSVAVALYVPFELFLFSYAVLGPLHYLTEISWLHERNYFTKGRSDFWLLAILAMVVFLMEILSAGHRVEKNTISAVAIFFAFFGALVFVLTRRERSRFIAFLVLALLAATAPWMGIFLVVFLPTLIHVYVFTGLFMLYGALKSRSRSGYLAFAIFLLCPLVFVFVTPEVRPLADYVSLAYRRFARVNLAVLSAAHRRDSVWDADPLKQLQPVFFSRDGWVVMRFIAFAYTYHYLNWFSKTSVIQWHRVSIRRWTVVLTLWLASVGLYVYDYAAGFTALFGLGFLHVALEFPLNHASVIGTLQEVRRRFAVANPQKAGQPLFR